MSPIPRPQARQRAPERVCLSLPLPVAHLLVSPLPGSSTYCRRWLLAHRAAFHFLSERRVHFTGLPCLLVPSFGQQSAKPRGGPMAIALIGENLPSSGLDISPFPAQQDQAATNRRQKEAVSAAMEGWRIRFFPPPYTCGAGKRGKFFVLALTG